MCFFCVEVAKKNMTPKEVARAYRELDPLEDHLGDVMAAIQINYGLDTVVKELNEIYEDAAMREHARDWKE